MLRVTLFALVILGLVVFASLQLIMSVSGGASDCITQILK